MREGESPKLFGSVLLAHVAVEEPLIAVSTSETRSRSHGREEMRRCHPFAIGSRLHKAEQWRDIRSFAVVERARTVGERTTVERRHYISCVPQDAAKIAPAIRRHWEVENRVHWYLDVQFGNAYARGHVAHNQALVRHIALNLLRPNTSRRTNIKTK